MQDIITVRGFVATDPVTRTTASGATVAGFRLATTERRFDREAGAWVDAHTNWYSVSAFGQLGSNTAQSVRKGNPVIVTGRLRVRDWSTEDRSGTTVDVVADAVGLDLAFGSAAFQRSQRAASARAHPRAEGLGAGEIAGEVDAQRQVPVLGRDLGQGAAAQDAGVVHQDVEPPAQRLHRARHEPVHRRPVRQVAGERDVLAP